MKIAIPAEGTMICRQLEDANLFYLFDIDGCMLLERGNFFPQGKELASALKSQGTNLVICSRIRSRTALGLRQARIEMILGAEGPVEDVLIRYLSGEAVGREE